MLVRYITAIGLLSITDLLQGIFDQGWTGAKIRAIYARRLGNVILVADEYTAIGSGAKSGETIDAKCLDQDRWFMALRYAYGRLTRAMSRRPIKVGSAAQIYPRRKRCAQSRLQTAYHALT